MVSCGGIITKLNKNIMNIQKRLQIEFEFLGDEQISANTALKIINDIFKEAENEQLTIGGVSHLLIAWEQYKKANWWESESVDVEKYLMEQFKQFIVANKRVKIQKVLLFNR